MEFGPDDFVMLCLRYLPSLACSIIACMAIIITIVIGKRRYQKRDGWITLAICFVPIPLLIWAVYLNSTYELSYTLNLLNSESSRTAEHIYNTRFKSEITSLNKAVSLAVSNYEAPNVRFYASCLIADMLFTNNDTAIQRTLEQVSDAGVITTQFFDGNQLTEPFYVPGHLQPQLSVREIVETRLKNLKLAR